MAAADDHDPFTGTEPQSIAVCQATIGGGQRIDHFPKRSEYCFVPADCRVVPSGGAVELDAVIGRLSSRVRRHQTTAKIFQAAHPEGCLEALRDPAGHAAMIRVHVGYQYAQHGGATQSS